jgi:hypothetical protein
MLVGHHVADDARRGLELVEFLARLGVDRFEITFERAVEDKPAARGKRA